MGPSLRYPQELIRRYRLDQRSKIVRNWLPLFEQGLIPENLTPAILLKIQPLIDAQERRLNLLFRAPDDVDELYSAGIPDLVLGRLGENEEIPLAVNPTGAFHLGFVGTTGSGKSYAIRALIKAIERANRKRREPLVVIIFDYKGGSFSDFPKLFGNHWQHFDAHGELRLGLQPPEGVPLTVWINHVAASFCARSGLIAARVTLANLMRWTVGVLNTKTSGPFCFPDFQLVLDVAQALPRTAFARKAPYLDSLLQILDDVTQASGDLFCAFNGLDVERDLIAQGKSAVIEVKNLSPDSLSNFVADLFVNQLLIGRLARGLRVNDPEVLLVFDDCDAVVSRDNERLFLTGMPPLVQGLRQFRELGVGVAIGAGALSPVSHQVLNSLSRFFIFQNPHDDCANAAKRTLGLPVGSQTLIQALEPGECIVRIPGPWSHAFLARIDEVPKGSRQQTDTHPYVPAKRLDELPNLVKAVEARAVEHRRSAAHKNLNEFSKLRDKARQLLMAWASHPFFPVYKLYELIGEPSAGMKSSIQQQLKEGEYASFEGVRIGKKPVVLMELEKNAWRLLGRSPIKLRGRGELPHRSFAHWLAYWGRKLGHEAFVEWNVPGSNHPVDVAWKVSNGAWEVFEVVVNCEDNLEGHLDAAFLTPDSPVTTLTIVASQKQLLVRIKRTLWSIEKLLPFHDRIRFISVADVLKELWP